MSVSRRHAVAVCLALLAVLAVPTAVAAPDDAVAVEQSLETDSVAPGESLAVTVSVDGDGIDAPGINISVPSNWTVTVEDDDDSDASSGDRAWLWRDGEDHTIELTVEVPPTAAAGAYELSATGSGIYRDTGERVTDRTVDEVEVSGDTALTADAGDDRTVAPGTAVELDGSGSTGPDGDALTYRWTQTGGPAVTLADNGTATPEFEAPDVTDTSTLSFELTVSDGNGTTATDTVAVTVERPNRPPTAVAGDDRTVAPETVVELDGSDSTDPDGDELAYAWTQIEGPSVSLEDDDSATPRVSLPSVDEPTALTFELTVSDGQQSSTDTVTVTVEGGQDPVAAAGGNQSVTEGSTVTLDGDGSEVSGNASYAWTQVDGPSVELDDASTASPSFDAPSVDGETTLTFELTVTDGQGRTDTDTSSVTVRPRSDGGDSGGGDSSGGDSGDDGGSGDDSGGGNSGDDGRNARGGGGGGGGGSAPAPEPSGPTIAIDRPDQRSAIVNVAVSSGDDAVEVRPNVSEGVLAYERLSLTPSASPTILRVASPEKTKLDVAGMRPLGTLATDTAADATVTVTFSVEAAALENGDAESVTAYRVADGSVTATNTTLVNDTDGRYHYRVTAAAPSELAVGVPVADIRVSEVRANRSEVSVGDPVAFTVTVANEGRRAGNETVRLGGVGNATPRTVSLAANETTTTTVVHRFETAGEYTVEAGTANTTVRVVADSTTTDTDTSGSQDDGPNDDETAARTSGGSGPGFGLVLTVLAVLVAGLLARRR